MKLDPLPNVIVEAPPGELHLLLREVLDGQQILLREVAALRVEITECDLPRKQPLAARGVAPAKRELLDEKRALRCELGPRRAAFIDSPLVMLVQTLARRPGIDVAFSASELIEHADDELREALGDMDAHALGRQLAWLEGRNVDGLCVTRIGRDASGVIWSIHADVLHAYG